MPIIYNEGTKRGFFTHMGTNFDDEQLENEFIIMGTTLNSVLTSQKINQTFGSHSVVN